MVPGKIEEKVGYALLEKQVTEPVRSDLLSLMTLEEIQAMTREPILIYSLYDLEDQRLGTVVIRVDTMYDGSHQLVLAQVAGKLVDMVPVGIPIFEAMARIVGCSALRAHVRRPGLKRLLEGQGFELSEYVMEMPCHGRE